jgi:hypothetical protein
MSSIKRDPFSTPCVGLEEGLLEVPEVPVDAGRH